MRIQTSSYPRLLAVLVLVFGSYVTGLKAQSPYDLPNNDTNCPGECRQIPWQAGSDLWNGGTLPTYAPVTCTGLIEGDGTTNNASAIQSCINSLGSQQAAVIPPGMYYVNSAITIPSNKVLRGAGAANCAQGLWITPTFHGDIGSSSKCTTLKLGVSGSISSSGSFSRGSTVALAS